MLRLINVCKSFKFGKNRTVILDNINLDFKKKELVFILGESGSGKSTLLNIIGGLLDVDSGKVMVDDMDITSFNNNMMCNYRNNMVGFIFQDYHLVEYMSVVDNIKLAQTIKTNTNNIESILRKLGIYSKRKMIVNRLSGGEKQRVAIARAIINDPDIILCDEPTGALDSVNSVRIMKILKEISNDKLVIVVSHDSKLASLYADRIININDGIIDYEEQKDDDKFGNIVKKKIGLLKIFKLGVKNLGLKKGRTIFTSLAISLGFICMVLVLCLSKGFSDDIDKLEGDIVSKFPISIYNGDFEIMDVDYVVSNEKIIRKNKDDYIHTNIINNKYLDYINEIDEVSYIGYDYDISMPIISDRYKILDNDYVKILPSYDFIDKNYDILYGSDVNEVNDVVIQVDNNNNVDSQILDIFDIHGDIDYDDIVGRKFKIILNDLYYVKNGDYYFINNDNKKLYDDSDFELEIVGIVRKNDVADNSSCIYFSGEIINYVLSKNSNSKIVIDQIDSDYNVLGMDMDKYKLLSYLGYDSLPSVIDIYVDDLDDKDVVIEKLDEYNKKGDNEKLIYVDTMNDAINIIKDMIDVITVILVIFSLISMLISSLMVFILTNNRVMERIKEIGILRSLGARRRDVSRLFNIENFIIGIMSSFIGVFFVYMLINPVNNILNILLEGIVFDIYIEIVIICIIFNIFIVVLSGYIPSKMASKKRIIDCINGRF